MATPNPYNKRPSPRSLARDPSPVSAAQPPRSPYISSFLCKSVFFALFLLALPLFPSQAPDFVGESVLTKFWELIHLLFIGIAVSYGLFSRRTMDSGDDSRTSTVDESSLSYLSRMFHVSSFFDYESEFDERNENRSIKVSTPNSALDKESESGSFAVESQLEDSFDSKINQVQAWNSQYFQGRSKVVVAQPSYGLDDYIGHKPLGLPVRSLRSVLQDTQAPQGICFSGSYDGAVSGNLGSFGSVELEKFDEVRAPTSPVPRQSRSERMAMRDNLREGGACPSNSRPLPVDEPQFETLKSRSFRSTASSSSQASFISHTQSRFLPSHSVSTESLNSMEESGKEQSLHGSSRSGSPSLSSSPSPSPPSPKLVTDDTYRRMSHSRHYSEGSLFEEDGRRDFEEESDGGRLKGRRTNFLSKKEMGSRSLKLTAEDFGKGSSSRKSYPPDSVSPSVGGEDSPTRWRSQQKSYDRLFEDITGKRWEEDPNNLRGKLRSNSLKRRGGNLGSLEPGTEDCDKDEKLHTPSPQTAPSPLTSAKAPSYAMDARLGGHGSLLDKDVKRNSEDGSVDFGRSRRRDLPGSKELKSSATLRWEPNSGKAANKFSQRGKSVRTVKSGRYAKDLNRDGESSDGWAEAEAERRGRTKLRSQRQDDISNKKSQEKLDQTRAKSKPRYFEDQNGKGKECCETYMMNDDDMEVEENEAEQPGVSIEEESGRGSLSESGPDPNEVDRKAGEFIAKFREQIRLQKLSSGELPRGIGNIGFR